MGKQNSKLICSTKYRLNDKDMTQQEAKKIYREKARVYNSNLIYIRRQANRQELAIFMNEYRASDDNHLAKILMLRGIQLGLQK